MTCYECEHFDPRTKICDINNDEILDPESNEDCGFGAEALEKLKAENRRLRKTLQEISEFANEEEKRIPSPSGIAFATIDVICREALKGNCK